MPLFTTKETGDQGEDIAATYLLENEYRIIGRNVRFGRDEIDIIAFDRHTRMTVFIEVKTRTTNNPQYPIRLAVDRRKRTCLKRAITKWCRKHAFDGPGRTDIICVSGNAVVEHLKELDAVFL